MNMKKSTMTLNLTRTEMDLIEQMAIKKGMNKTALVKQALRLYQTIELRIDNGEKIFSEDDKKQKTELLLI